LPDKFCNEKIIKTLYKTKKSFGLLIISLIKFHLILLNQFNLNFLRGTIKMTRDDANQTNLPEVADDQKIEEAVKIINEKANETIYKGSIEIGEYILKEFFENKIELARSKNPRKEASFNKLCERDDLNIHPNRLGIMIRVASQERLLTEKEIDTSSLSFTHKASLVKIHDDNKKITLINKCIENNWTTRKLEKEITKKLEKLQPGKDSSIIQITKKYITKVEDVIKTVEDSSLNVNDDDLSKMTPSRLDKLEAQLKNLKKKAADFSKKSETLTTGCDNLLDRVSAAKKDRERNPPKRGRKPKNQEN
jgi:hypothetical protein